MAVKTLYKTINTNGEYSCGDIGVTTEEWLDLLNDEKSKPYHEALLCFLRQKEHKATCVRGCVKIDTSSFLLSLYLVYHIIRYLLQLCC